jgi:chromosome partitioning protein
LTRGREGVRVRMLKHRHMVITVATTKGGIGKSTTVANLAAAWAEQGMRVLAIDLDPGFTLTRMFGQTPVQGQSAFDLLVYEDKLLADVATKEVSPGVDLIPAHRDLSGLDLSLASAMHREYRLREKLAHTTYDVVLVDTPPAGNLITTNALVAADYAVGILSSRDAQSLQGIQEIEQMIATMRAGGPQITVALLAVIRTHVRERSRLHRALSDDPQVQQLPLAKTEVPMLQQLPESVVFGKPQIVLSPDSTTACAYRRLSTELTMLIQKENSDGQASTLDSANGRSRQPTGKLPVAA